MLWIEMTVPFISAFIANPGLVTDHRRNLCRHAVIGRHGTN
jgi:hypothetical protein